MSPEVFENYKVGIAEIDRQHWKLLNSHNRIVQYAKQNNGLFVKRELSSLVTELRKHFEFEEMYMRHIEYPYLVAHAKEHNRLFEEAIKLSKYNQTDYMPNIWLLNTLEKIIVNHIDHDDSQIALFLKEKPQKTVYNPDDL